jgi:hypothetical protein
MEVQMSLAVVRDTASVDRRRPPQDICAVVEGLRARHRRADNERLAGMLLEILDEDRDLLRAAANFIVDKVVAVAATRERQQAAAPTPRQRAERQVAEKAAVTRLAAKVKERVLLDLPVVLLTGETKPLRFCLGRELGELGHAYTRIAEKVAPDEMIGERLTEAELKALLAAGA